MAGDRLLHSSAMAWLWLALVWYLLCCWSDPLDFSTHGLLLLVYTMDKVPIRVDGRFRLGDVLGSDLYAVVYHAWNIIKDDAVAVKLKPITCSSSMQQEYNILKHLDTCDSHGLAVSLPSNVW
ncbi:hypothetical protein EV702DRAFT_1050883 [Suillus placidus]|uniref:Uncharacterized protein n=1 Tax=Suillus placidus TaxID=48579 RepID=A0A9P7CX59_9AGAM|nr:hypothetical protein EV702DRAFT_1050883 [Suillus placidus]